MSEALVALVTALGDDELILGHRHSEWTGYAPHIEEDVAFSSIAQDEIGHAAGYYSIAAAAAGGDPDVIALGRPANAYRNAILCERPNSDWAYTLARHWVYDIAEDIRLEALEGSAHADLAGLATKIRREERYHQLHASMWLKRVAGGPVEGRTKLSSALSLVMADVPGLFEPFELEDEAVKEGFLPVPSGEQLERFKASAAEGLEAAGLPDAVGIGASGTRAELIASSSGDLIARDEDGDGAADPPDGAGGRYGRHTPSFDELWDVMTVTYRDNPGATW
ncbi:MAG TPA: 1,2-phenylacetyl-CoA epoxidase subunit PaaC [Actinomycetota bacterium]|nr:1,2-phenylacetyl-CoA epoxidase subunit PaaC [Actinomycetota bacterium]